MQRLHPEVRLEPGGDTRLHGLEGGADFLCVGMYDFQIVDDVNVALDVLRTGVRGLGSGGRENDATSRELDSNPRLLWQRQTS
jgi:hypothetical protein